jgi:hypothetical protein
MRAPPASGAGRQACRRSVDRAPPLQQCPIVPPKDVKVAAAVARLVLRATDWNPLQPAQKQRSYPSMGNHSHVDGGSRFQNPVECIDDPSLGGACGLPSSHTSVRMLEEEIRRGFKLLARQVACGRAVVLSELGSCDVAQGKMSSEQLCRVHRFAFLTGNNVPDVRDPGLFEHPADTSFSPARQFPLRDWSQGIDDDFRMGDEVNTCHRIKSSNRAREAYQALDASVLLLPISSGTASRRRARQVTL